MGNQPSLPEAVFAAVTKNNVPEFQSLVKDFGAVGQGDPAARQRILEHKDKAGRTPLLLAAAKNHYQILQQLIALGADIHYINPHRDSAGSALHEAAARRHEAVVEALLHAGANPFAANACGRTALEVAVEAEHAGVVRAIERYADFAGTVAFKSRTMAGLSFKYKSRWAVLMPYYPYRGTGPTGGRTGLQPRRCLWLYKHKGSIAPRSRLWLDGARVFTAGPAGTEGTLRLSLSAGEPTGDLVTKHKDGYCVYLRPADLTQAAAGVYHALMQAVSNPSSGTAAPDAWAARVVSMPPSATPPLQHQGPRPSPPSAPAAMAGAGVWAPPSPSPPPPGPPPPPVTYPPPPVYGYGASPVPYPVVPVPPAYPGAAGPSPMASPLTLYQHQQQQYGTPPPMASPGAAPPPAAHHEVHPAPAAGEAAVSEVFIERMAALPGETDEEFAARLASAVSVLSGRSQQNLYPAASDTNPTAAPPAASPRSSRPDTRPPFASAAGAQPTSPSPATTPAGAPLLNFQSDPGNGPQPQLYPYPAPPAPYASNASITTPGPSLGPYATPASPGAAASPAPAPTPALGALDDLDMVALSALIAREAAGRVAASNSAAAAAGPSGGSAAAPPGYGQAQQGPAAQPHRCCVADDEPSAPPAPAAPPRPEPDPDDNLCVICLSAPKQVGYLHGDCVHRCVCRACASSIGVGRPCPLCRAPIERVLGVY
ncbi:hypothetical protein HYH03_013052 [Edaphochlamys debaryana]|uniref:RING-type domain-containing protein n=1 Tax=Edaphochlamys debaryana TaxID=47281 RepID=A0A835XRN1_9CHLO|nr:hypothetical protein HYH03_013052 [Edaphochlamys debaryana]|eukprot:KAG2488362.1 hypothetical protein HYH03_013052 [Edaphochlamys debaryana]